MKMKIETLHQICALKSLVGVFAFMGGDVWQVAVEVSLEDEAGGRKTTAELLREIKGKAVGELIAALEAAVTADEPWPADMEGLYRLSSDKRCDGCWWYGSNAHMCLNEDGPEYKRHKEKEDNCGAWGVRRWWLREPQIEGEVRK